MKRTTGVLLSAALIGGLAFTPSGSQAASGKALPRPMRVAEALSHLAGSANAVASRHGSSAAHWKSLADDTAAWVDQDGALFYIDPLHAGAAAEPVVALAAPFDYAQTFLLHSNPTATRKLHLDFDGHSFSGTAWANGAAMTAEPYNSDATAGFSNAEMDQIQATWQRVAEDYAPFNIDVTTEDPGYAGINRSSTTDTAFGTRVVITGTTAIYNAACSGGCGGVAYLGVIDSTGSTHDFYQPAWVFTNGVGYGAKNISEAASHEAGHNLGLNHDGTASVGYYTGHGAWAPIMGVGYYEPVSQWSRGEYSGANNSEDDFATAASNSIPLRADDFGSLAAPSAAGTSPVAISGVIHSRTDQDVFQFATSGGLATFSASPAAVGANLDIQLQLVDSAGAVVASNNPAVVQIDAGSASGLGASVSATLAAGTYRVVVDGVGYLDPLTTGYSDYGNVGAYTLTGSYDGAMNQAPIAVASASTTSGVAPLAVTFSGTGSNDLDGSIASYSWAFSDGTTATTATVAKTFTAAGTYTATLTVTDNVGAVSAPSSVTVTVTVPVITYIKVQTLTMTIATSGGNRRTASTVVRVTDQNNAIVSGVVVTGAYSGVTSGTVSGTTGTTGTVTLRSARTTASTGTFTFTIGSLSKSGTTYVAANNLVSSVSRSF